MEPGQSRYIWKVALNCQSIKSEHRSEQLYRKIISENLLGKPKGIILSKQCIGNLNEHRIIWGMAYAG